MRLIDADEFKKQIAGMAIVNNYPADKANKLCELIDSQKTAYDVDKVVEQLKKNSMAFMGDKNDRDVDLNEAIKIVKAEMKG